MVEHRAEIAHVEIAAAGFTSPKMLGFVYRRTTGLLADDFPGGIGGVMLAILVMPWLSST